MHRNSNKIKKEKINLKKEKRNKKIKK